jgi:hypothetical protein
VSVLGYIFSLYIKRTMKSNTTLGFHGSSVKMNKFEFKNDRGYYYFSLKKDDWCYIDSLNKMNPDMEEYVPSNYMYTQMLDMSKLLTVENESELPDDSVLNEYSGILVTIPEERYKFVPYVAVWNADALVGTLHYRGEMRCTRVDSFKNEHVDRDRDYDEDSADNHGYEDVYYILGYQFDSPRDDLKVHAGYYKPNNVTWIYFNKGSSENRPDFELDRTKKTCDTRIVLKSKLIHIVNEKDVMLFTSKFSVSSDGTSLFEKIDWDKVREETGKSGIAVYLEEREHRIQWTAGWNSASIAVWDEEAFESFESSGVSKEYVEDVIVGYSSKVDDDDGTEDDKTEDDGTEDDGTEDEGIEDDEEYHMDENMHTYSLESSSDDDETHISASTLIHLKTRQDLVLFYSKYFSEIEKSIDWDKVKRNTMKFGIAVHEGAFRKETWSSETTYFPGIDVPFVAVWNNNAFIPRDRSDPDGVHLDILDDLENIDNRNSEYVNYGNLTSCANYDSFKNTFIGKFEVPTDSKTGKKFDEFCRKYGLVGIEFEGYIYLWFPFDVRNKTTCAQNDKQALTGLLTGGGVKVDLLTGHSGREKPPNFTNEKSREDFVIQMNKILDKVESFFMKLKDTYYADPIEEDTMAQEVILYNIDITQQDYCLRKLNSIILTTYENYYGEMTSWFNVDYFAKTFVGKFDASTETPESKETIDAFCKKYGLFGVEQANEEDVREIYFWFPIKVNALNVVEACARFDNQDLCELLNGDEEPGYPNIKHSDESTDFGVQMTKILNNLELFYRDGHESI